MDLSIDPKRQEEARRYATAKRALFVADLALGAAYLVVLLATGAAVSLRDALAATPGGRVGTVAAYFLAVFVGYAILSLPLGVIGGWWLPRRHGLSVQTATGWLVDWLKGNLVGLGIGLAAIEVVYWLLLGLPGLWWLIAGVLYLLLVVGLANLGPVLLLPLFFKLSPLEPSPLTESLRDLARRAGTQVRGVYRMELSAKTTAANAALMGLGNTRRIVLGDTLLDRYTPREIEVIFAHELGHHVHHDVPRLVVGHALVTLGGLFVCSLVLARAAAALGYTGIADVATLPLLALVLSAFGVITTPLMNFVSRQMERQADLYALRTTGDADAFVDAMTRLANQNLAELDPARWVEVLFYDHPAVGARIRLARRFSADRPTG